MVSDSGFRISNRARAEIQDIWQFTLERWSPPRAAAYVTELDRVFGLLADFPELGVLRSEIRPPVRVHRFKAHLIVYRDLNPGIEILRVLHMRQDWMAALSE